MENVQSTVADKSDEQDVLMWNKEGGLFDEHATGKGIGITNI